jgi:hypothetical protein
VDAVITWHYPVAADGYGWAPTGLAGGFDFKENAEKAIADAIGTACTPGSGVTVRARVVQGNPAQVLLDASDDADLLVVGSRVHGGFTEALLGPNGAGKTTLIRVLTTLLKADCGRARVAGLDVQKDARAIRSLIGLAGQYATVDELLTGRENPRVSLRIVTMPIQSQGIITRDNVSVDVSAVAYFRVVDAVKSVVALESARAAIDQLAQTTLRKVVGLPRPREERRQPRPGSRQHEPVVEPAPGAVPQAQ